MCLCEAVIEAYSCMDDSIQFTPNMCNYCLCTALEGFIKEDFIKHKNATHLLSQMAPHTHVVLFVKTQHTRTTDF